jgi:hypothetical protein
LILGDELLLAAFKCRLNWQSNCHSSGMNLSFIIALLLGFNLNAQEIELKNLIGKWQLVYFDGIDKVKTSPQYRSSDSAMRANIEYKIKSRLENTVYDFFSVDSLNYTDYRNNVIVMKKAKINLKKANILTIFDGKVMREAKILELEANRLVLEPISQSPGAGKLVFERIIAVSTK